MQVIRDTKKNEWIKKQKDRRGVTFELVERAIADGKVLAVLPNSHKYPGEEVMLVEIDQYVFCVPFLQRWLYLKLKTVFPSRKYTREYLKK